MKSKSKPDYDACVGLIESCLKHEVWKITGKRIVSEEERKQAIEFMFGEPVEKFLDKYDVNIDIKKLRAGIIARLVDADDIKDILYNLPINQSEAI